MSKEDFAETLIPLIETFHEISLNNIESAREKINSFAPFDGDLVGKIRQQAEAGLQEEWLLTKEIGGMRFGRVAKDLNGYSVDAVFMSGPGPKHRHPKGEIDLCFALSGKPTFDEEPEGWVLYEPDSVHVPTVQGGEMLILYFLPEGAFEMVK